MSASPIDDYGLVCFHSALVLTGCHCFFGFTTRHVIIIATIPVLLVYACIHTIPLSSHSIDPSLLLLFVSIVSSKTPFRLEVRYYSILKPIVGGTRRASPFTVVSVLTQSFYYISLFLLHLLTGLYCRDNILS